MNKRLIVVSFFTSLLFAYSSYAQTGKKSDATSKEEQIESASKDSTVVSKEHPSIQQIRLKGKINTHSRYKDLAREKERRKKIRAKYQKEKLLKSSTK